MGPPVSRRIARVRRYSSADRRWPCVSPTRLSRSTAPLSRRLRVQVGPSWRSAARRNRSYNPASATPAGLTRIRFRQFPVRSPLLRGYSLFLGVLRCFNSPGALRQTAVTTMRSLGCPIRRSWDRRSLAAPPRLSQQCHVLHRHAAPRHPPSAPSVFPEGRRGRKRYSVACLRPSDSRPKDPNQSHNLHLVRYAVPSRRVRAFPPES